MLMEPKHIAIVLDGNRRYARKLGLKAWKGHEFGAEKVGQLIDWCRDLGVKELTLYSFSIDNFKRPEAEKKALFSLFKKYMAKLEKDPRIKKDGIRISFIGRLEMFPKDMRESMNRAMGKSRSNKKFRLNFAMAYSGKAEITDSIRKIIKKINSKKLKMKDVDEKVINDNLYLGSEPDVLIRPGGEKRLSDFLLWQSAYSELFFLDKLWPEMEKEDIKGIIEEFRRRERRFGK